MAGDVARDEAAVGVLPETGPPAGVPYIGKAGSLDHQPEWSRQSTDDATPRSFSSGASTAEPETVDTNTVVVFDWDDTLLCTSYLNLHQGRAMPEAVQDHLRGIERAVMKLLEQSLQHGHTFIVTNAVSGWVEFSAAQYIPAVVPLLQRVRIISARAEFEEVFPGEAGRWKSEAFLALRGAGAGRATNLLALGDHQFEMDAVQALGSALEADNGSNVLVKTVKFRERPNPEELRKQLELVGQKFERIIDGPKGLKIGLERKWAGSAKAPSS